MFIFHYSEFPDGENGWSEPVISPNEPGFGMRKEIQTNKYDQKKLRFSDIER